MRIAIITSDNREEEKHYDAPQPIFGTAPEALIQGFSLVPDVEVHVLCAVRRPVLSPEKLAENIWYHPLLVPKIGWMSTAYAGCILATRKKLREIQPDLVHGQGTERNCAISAVMSGFPNVLTIHGNMRLIAKVNHVKPFSYGWLNAYLETFTLPRSQGVICITHYTEEAVRPLACRTWVLPNAVDARFFDVSRNPSEVPELLVVGRICLRKNQNAFIRALDSLAAKRPFRLLFLGHTDAASPYDAEFLELVRQRAWCRWDGWADRETLRARLSTAAAVALPSIEDNCPMVVLEAMAAGVPVIAPNVGGVPDLVTDGVNGLLCDPSDAQSMAGAVERILGDPNASGTLAATAKEEAAKRFHPRLIAERHVAIYREVLDSSRSRKTFW